MRLQGLLWQLPKSRYSQLWRERTQPIEVLAAALSSQELPFDLTELWPMLPATQDR
jgi:hypothetical protein